MTLLDRPRPPVGLTGLWRLSAVAAEAFADQPQTRAQWPVARRPVLRLMLLLSLVVSQSRVHPSGRALCLLSYSSSGARARGVGLAGVGLVGLSLLVVLVPWVFWLVVLVVIGMLVPQLHASLKARPARAELTAVVPTGPYVGVHTVASLLPGAGRELMQRLNEEADEKGWILLLDAANESLADYYASLGYLALTAPVPMPWGEQTVRMMRMPSPS